MACQLDGNNPEQYAELVVDVMALYSQEGFQTDAKFKRLQSISLKFL